jgi:hypothetical protein
MQGRSEFDKKFIGLHHVKRLLLSVVGGFGIPFLYSIMAVFLSPHFGNDRIKYLFWVPIGWPKILYFYVLLPFSNRALNLEDDGLLVIMIACDVILYGSLTYSLLLLRSFRKVKAHTEPPPGPTFLTRPGQFRSAGREASVASGHLQSRALTF